MRIRWFSTGRVRQKRGARGVRRYLPGGWSTETLPVNVFLVEHPSGLCLFDTGQRAKAAVRGYFPWWHPFFKLARFELSGQDEAVAQLRGLGYEPADVRWVVLSHLHTDHAGGVEAFGSAEVLVSRTEWARARGTAGKLRGYLPQRWPRGLEPRLVDLDHGEVFPFYASYDVAGDGRLLVVPLHGHTAGHLGLLVSEGRPTHLLIGDAAPNADELAEVQPAVARFCRAEGVTVLATHGELAPEAP